MVNKLNLIFNDSDIYESIPLVPKNLNVTSAGSTTIDLEWDAVSGADTYTVFYKNKDSGDVESVSGIAGTTQQLTSLQENVQYEIWVVSIKSGVSSLESVHVSQTTTDSQPPTLPNTQLSTSSVTQSGWIVDFVAASDDVSSHANITYSLYISTGNNIGTVANAKANGTLVASDTGVTALPVSGLLASQTRWFNVIAKDEAGNEVAYTQNSETTLADTSNPTPTISSDNGSYVNSQPVPITINWDEDVQNFAVEDVTISSGVKQNFTQVSASQYTFEIASLSEGAVNIDISAGVCQDVNGNSNNAASQVTVTYDTTGPTPTITSSESSPTNNDPIPIEVDFGEVVSGFLEGNLIVAGGSIQNFSTADNQTFTFDINPDSLNESITVDINANVCQDQAGNNNNAATQFAISYDGDIPTVTITAGISDPTNQSSFVATIQFSENVSNFVIGDIVTSNCSLSNFNTVSASQYEVTVAPDSDGLFSVDVPQGVTQDSAGNDNQAATQFSAVYDSTAPVVSSGTITVTNETETTADFGYTKASDALQDDTTLVYKLYRSLYDDEFPNDSDLSTLNNIDANGSVVAQGIDVASLSETNATSDTEYRYNITVEDGLGNRSLYTQVLVSYVSATVNSVSINESYDHVDQADGTLQLSATVNATNVDDTSVNWSSSNTEIATVDANGLVTFVATGEVTITATSNFDNTKKGTLTFTIYEYSASSEEFNFTTTA